MVVLVVGITLNDVDEALDAVSEALEAFIGGGG